MLISIAFFYIVSVGAVDSRRIRRTIITGDVNSIATGNDTNTNTELQAVQGNGGELGVNFTSQGAANGENSITIGNSGAGSVDYQNGTSYLTNGQGNVGATGAQVAGSSNINGQVLGNNQSIDSQQHGEGSGAGQSSAGINGSATIGQDGLKSPFSTDNVQLWASANGSESTGAEVSSGQQMSWDEIVAQMVAEANGQGANNAGANIGISANNNNGNSVSVNGVIGGTGSDVNAQANGSALLVDNMQDTNVNLHGLAAGEGSSSIDGAGQLGTSAAGTNKTLEVYGNGKADVDHGQSGAESSMEGSLNSANGGQALNHINVTAESTQKNITVSNGIAVSDQNGKTLAEGGGMAQGVGSQNSSAIMAVDTRYDNNGEASVVIQGDGTAVSQNNTSALVITADGQLLTSKGVNNTGSATSMGTASGEYNNVTGSSFLIIDNMGSNGNAYVDAIGGGKGNSDANTQAVIKLNDGLAGERNATVIGTVSAVGNETYVRSISGITDYAGMQTFTSYQNSTAKGSGTSHASTGSLISVGRKKRQLPLQDDQPSPVVQEFSIMKICPNTQTTNKNCPLFIKSYDPVTGSTSWEHIEISDLVKNLFGSPVSRLSDKGNDNSARLLLVERTDDWDTTPVSRNSPR
uniref:Uncharacterized protein n=1 Tax=Plectus sambesii TaxID=2011161 RepID=A0A914VUK1_9BILA